MTVGRKGPSRGNYLKHMINQDRRKKRKQEQQRKYSKQQYDKPVASEVLQ